MVFGAMIHRITSLRHQLYTNKPHPHNQHMPTNRNTVSPMTIETDEGPGCPRSLNRDGRDWNDGL